MTVQLQGNLLPEPTADGSMTFFSEDFGEWFHSREGAYAEAQQTYVATTRLAEKAATVHRISILDVCYGLGYNSAAALETLWRVNPNCHVVLIGLELDARVPQQAIQHLGNDWSAEVSAVLAALAQGHAPVNPRIQAQLHLGDARQTIQTLMKQHFQADAIFLDPFSPPHCPELWTVEFLARVAQCLKASGLLATYSCAAAVRTALMQAGLAIGPSVASGRRWPGTLASWSDVQLSPLSLQEKEHLKTRAAVPYRDPQLTDTATIIFQRRTAEQAQSTLEPTSRWRKRWLP